MYTKFNIIWKNKDTNSTSSVDFVRIILINWGTLYNITNTPAMYPTIWEYIYISSVVL